MKLIHLITAVTCLAALPLSAQNHPSIAGPNSCVIKENKDWWKIEDDGEGQAIVSYYNSDKQCSREVDELIKSPNGIEVRIIVSVSAGEGNHESFTVIPSSNQYMAFPADLSVKDGDTATIRVQGGLM